MSYTLFYSLDIKMNTPTRRFSYTIAKKIEVIKAYETRFNFNAPATSEHFGIHRSMLSRWVRDKDDILHTPKTVKRNSQARAVGEFPQLEDRLYEWIKSQREKKISIKRYRLKVAAKRIAKTLNIDTSSTRNGKAFSFSAGWERGFMSRYHLSDRANTHVAPQNKKSLHDSRKIVFLFLHQCRHEVSAIYEKQFIYNMDETPIYLDMPHKRTLAPTGSKSIDVITSGNEKTRITVCLTITAAGKLLPAYVLFKNLVKVPKVNLPSNVVLNVNKSGTMNEHLMVDYFDKIIKPYNNNNKSIILMDEFKAHFTDRVQEQMVNVGIDHMRIPGGFTSTLQPLDVSINKPFKALYRDEWTEWMEKDPIFTPAGNRQKPSYQCLVDMISRCMTALEDRNEMIAKSFVCTGIIQDINKPVCHRDYNNRLAEYVRDDEDWDMEEENMASITQNMAVPTQKMAAANDIDFDFDDEFDNEEVGNELEITIDEAFAIEEVDSEQVTYTVL